MIVESCDPRHRGDAIIELFARNARPEFAGVFQRAYGVRAEAGARSWVGMDDAGKVVMHVAAWSRPFRQGTQRWRVAVMGDLMADPEYRTFWGPISLLRRAVQDLRAEGYDLLVSDPSPPSAGVVRAAGFQSLGDVRRYVEPLNLPWVVLSHLRSGTFRSIPTFRLESDASLETALARLGSGDAFRAVATPSEYRTRVPGIVYPEAYWLGIGAPGDFVALLLVAPDRKTDSLQIADALWDERRVTFVSLLLAAVHHARSEAYRKLSVSLLESSKFARAAMKAGFIRRPDAQPFVWQQFRADVPALDEWWLTPLDGSGW